MIDDFVQNVVLKHPHKYLEWVKEYVAIHPVQHSNPAYYHQMEAYLREKYAQCVRVTEILPAHKK